MSHFKTFKEQLSNDPEAYELFVQVARQQPPDLSSFVLTEITLPGTYVPEIKGKQVILIGRKVGFLISLLELRGSPLKEETGESLITSITCNAIGSDIKTPDDAYHEIEAAAKRYFQKT